MLLGFWDVGHALFKSTPESFPIKFIPGDIFDPTFFSPDGARASAPDLASLTNLTPLTGHVSAISGSSFFHLFSEDRQRELAQLFNALLSPEPGSIMFGQHVGSPNKGLRVDAMQRGQKEQDVRMFCHSPESWKEMWEGVCGQGKVDVQTILMEVERRDCVMLKDVAKFYLLVWSVKRI